MFDPRTCDLRKLNTLTKYPSIETYHKLGDRGRLTEEIQIDFGTEEVSLTEKVNGANARIVLLSDEYGRWSTYIIGSREEFLHARGDIIIHGDPTAVAIVETLRPHAQRLYDTLGSQGPYMGLVVFGEVYGGSIGGKVALQYTSDPTTFGFRVFDAILIRDFVAKLEDSIEIIAARRQRGEQPFFLPITLRTFGDLYGMELVPTVGYQESALPTSVAGMYALLQQTGGKTACTLDTTGHGKAEGLVIRNADRTKIAKVRFEEYERTLKGTKMDAI